MPRQSIPVEDIHLAIRLGLCFEITKRDKPREEWQTVSNSVEDLGQAINEARRVEAFETAVWRKSESGNFLYWMSAIPGLFNSAALEFLVKVTD